MDISKLNPIGYKEKTAKGNEYTRSNVGKTSAILTSVAVDLFINHLEEKNCYKKIKVPDSTGLEKFSETIVKNAEVIAENAEKLKGTPQDIEKAFIDNNIKLKPYSGKTKTIKIPKAGYLKGMIGGLAISIITFLGLFALGKNYDDKVSAKRSAEADK